MNSLSSKPRNYLFFLTIVAGLLVIALSSKQSIARGSIDSAESWAVEETLLEGSISGTVVLQGRTDHSDAQVCADDGGTSICTQTDAAGAYNIVVPAGSYKVTITKEGYLDAEMLNVLVNVGSVTTLEPTHPPREEVKTIQPTSLSAPALKEHSLLQKPDAPSTVQSPVSATYFVSKNGSNGDGKSWATAWNELDQINWDVIQPGDTILLDGGASEMIYRTTLTIRKSGTNDQPITIKLANEPGRDGRVIIFGGRSTPLPFCGQLNYTFETDGVRSIGIVIEGHSWVVIDGTKWRGITIYGHNRNGVRLYSSSSHVTVRNVEIYDNGWVSQRNGEWFSDGPGVDLSGTNITFERAIIHDNGQDAFQSGGGIDDFMLGQSWLHNARLHPNNPDRSFNECTHSDGIQIYGGGVQSGVLIQNSIVGPGFMQGVMLGGSGQPNPPWAVINDVTIQNSLFFKSSNAEISSNYNSTTPENWRIENVTTFAQINREWHNIYLEGTGHNIQNSVFYGGRSITLPDGGFVAEGNCQWQVGGKTVGLVEDPLFVDVDEYDWFSLDNFTIQNPACEGSSITSVSQLLAQPDSSPVVLPFPVTLLGGDINDDCDVNILDITLVGGHIGLGCSNTGWDARADINNDCTVNILDLSLTGTNFGKSCPVSWD